MTYKKFTESNEIHFGLPGTVAPKTSEAVFEVMEFFLKKKTDHVIIRTGIFSSSKELGESMVLEKYCNQ
jgi:hypothetical protein